MKKKRASDIADTVWGDILRVDLSTGKIKREPMSRELKLNFVGARGVNSKILYDEVKPGVEPLSPQNVLILGTGPIHRSVIASSEG